MARAGRALSKDCCCRWRLPHWSPPVVVEDTVAMTEAVPRLRRRHPRQPPAAVIRDAQFVDDTVEGWDSASPTWATAAPMRRGQIPVRRRPQDRLLRRQRRQPHHHRQRHARLHQRRGRLQPARSHRGPGGQWRSLSIQPAARARPARRQRRQQRWLPDRRRREHGHRRRGHRHQDPGFRRQRGQLRRRRHREGAGHGEESHADLRRRSAGAILSCCSASHAPRASRSPATTRAPWS